MTAALSIPTTVTRVDQNALRFNQVMIVVLVVLAFVLDLDWLVLATGLCLAAGAAFPGRGPFQIIYRSLLIPSGLIKPKPELEDPRPHRFAQSVGTTCLIVASLFLLIGWDLAGWIVAWLVVALALVNLLFGFCAGCFLYLHIARLRPAGGSVR